MSGLTLAWVLAAGLPVLALHLLAVCLTRALRTYSRIRLQEVSAARGRPGRAAAIARHDERAERAAEAVAVLTGLALAALLGAAVARSAPLLTIEAVVAIALTLGALGHVAAGIVGRVHAEVVLDALWPVAEALRRAAAPLTFTARQVEAVAYRRSRRAATSPRPPSLEVEIPAAPPDEAGGYGSDLNETSRRMLERVVELSVLDVSELMTPRSGIVTLPATASAREAARTFVETGRSRIPLFGEHRDDVVGVLYAKDLFPRLVEAADPAAVVPRKIARPPWFVPETKNATELLEEFRTRRVQIAIVLDEYGGVSGLITLEDLLEELVGPIDDEHDEPTPSDLVIDLGGASYEVDAAVTLEDLNERLGLKLPTDEEFTTVGGFAFNALGHLPEPGASFRRDGVEITVLEVAGQSIRRLRLDLQPAEPVESR